MSANDFDERFADVMADWRFDLETQLYQAPRYGALRSTDLVDDINENLEGVATIERLWPRWSDRLKELFLLSVELDGTPQAKKLSVAFMDELWRSARKAS